MGLGHLLHRQPGNTQMTLCSLLGLAGNSMVVVKGRLGP